jgi:hypothetical protein
MNVREAKRARKALRGDEDDALRKGFSTAGSALHWHHRRGVQLNAPTMKTMILNAEHRKAPWNLA